MPAARCLALPLVRGPFAVALAAALAGLAGPAQAAGARQGVTPEHGELVLLRDVSARHAIRQAPPGMALIADPSPRHEIDASLGTGELSDEEYAALGAGVSTGLHAVSGIDQRSGQALGDSLAAAVQGGHGALSGPGMGQLIGGPMGAVGSATRGVGDQLRGAMSQLPIPRPPTPAVPGGGPGG